MMSEQVTSTGWRTATIEDIAEKVAMGPFGSSIKVETFVPDGIPIVSGQHLRGFRLDDGPGFNFITDEHAQRLANANVIRGDVVFTHAGNIGQVAYIPDNSKFDRYVISQRQFYLRCDQTKTIPEFVTMYFKSHEGQHQLLANASQVGVPSIAQPVTYLRTIEIPLPPLSEQRAIAHVLGTLDEIRRHGHVLTPGRYVGAPPQEDDGEPFEDKMARPQQAVARAAGRGAATGRGNRRKPGAAGVWGESPPI